MAVAAIKVTLGQSLGEGFYNSTGGPGPADPLAAALTAKTSAATSNASVDTAKTASALLETNVIALDALSDVAVAAKVAGAAVTAVQDAMDVLQADAAAPTEAHVDTADAAWDTVSAAITALHTAVDNVKTASAARETDAIALDALVDTAVTDSATAETDTTTSHAALAGNLVLLIDTAVITSMNMIRAAVKKALFVLSGSSTLTQ